MLHEPQVDLGSTTAADEAVATEVIHIYMYIYTYIYMCICIWISNMHVMMDTCQWHIQVSNVYDG